jgi:hypothetical protein
MTRELARWNNSIVSPKTDTREFTAPASGIGNDWVLVLDDAAKNDPAAGKPKS